MEFPLDSPVPSAVPEAVLWDLDGTLIDSEPYWMAAERDLVLSAGGVWSEADALACVGATLTGTAARMSAAGARGSAEVIVAELIARVTDQMHTQGVPWRPGARELLGVLRQARIPRALVTMSYRSVVDVVARVLPQGSFDVVVTGDEVAHGKPHPEPYLRAASLLGVIPRRCLAIEDSPTGVASAEAAGARVLGVPAHAVIPAAPRRSRLPSLEGVDLAVIARLMAGEVIDEVAA